MPFRPRQKQKDLGSLSVDRVEEKGDASSWLRYVYQKNWWRKWDSWRRNASKASRVLGMWSRWKLSMSTSCRRTPRLFSWLASSWQAELSPEAGQTQYKYEESGFLPKPADWDLHLCVSGSSCQLRLLILATLVWRTDNGGPDSACAPHFDPPASFYRTAWQDGSKENVELCVSTLATGGLDFNSQHSTVGMRRGVPVLNAGAELLFQSRSKFLGGQCTKSNQRFTVSSGIHSLRPFLPFKSSMFQIN